MHLFLILSSVILVVSILSVLELRTVPAGNGTGVEEPLDMLESVRSGAFGFVEVDDEPFTGPLESLGDGFVDTDGPAVANRKMIRIERTAAKPKAVWRTECKNSLAEPESFASTLLFGPAARVPTASFHYAKCGNTGRVSDMKQVTDTHSQKLSTYLLDELLRQT